ncbi:MAG: 30S ribosomal protein S8 [Candidatus Vogelbacteria bacterium]|nr:30S ribosomal protein S8 [Candidatus Vogelbacteria bacterium]
MDPIAQMLTSLKNAAMARKTEVVIPFSKVKMAMAEILEREGYLVSAVKKGKKMRHFIYCELAYQTDNPRLQEVKRVSKLSKRVYAGYQELHPVRQGRGLTIVSTPHGLLTDKQARIAKVGGEVLCQIW